RFVGSTCFWVTASGTSAKSGAARASARGLHSTVEGRRSMASRLATQIDEQKAANQSALPYDELYRGHREQLTGRILRTIQEGSGRSLCVLGAGNCYDLDLERLS